MYAIDFISQFSVAPIPEPDTTLAELLKQTEAHNTTLTLTTSRRGLVNQVNTEAVEETIDVAAQHPRLLPVGTLDPRYFLNWQDDLRTCVEGGCVAIRFAPGPQGWSPNMLLFEKMAAAVGEIGLPMIVDFNGAGAEAQSWIHQIGAITQRHNVRAVLNEVSYAYVGELITVMQEYPNVYAAIRWLCLANGLEVMVEAGIGDRLLYGSNSPKYSIRSLRNQIFMANISNEEKQAILGGNALRLLDMDIEELAVEPLLIKTTPDLPEKPIIDIHAHVSGFHVAQPHNTRTETNVPEMTERCNIELTFVSSYNAINYDMRQGNADTQQFLDRYSNLRGYVVGDPRDIPGSVEQMERYFKDSRFVGVKLYCPFGGNMATQRMQDLLDEVAKFGRPVKIHMDDDGSPYAGLRQAALRNPNLIIIKAHGDDAEGARQVVDLPNVYFEFCSSGIHAGRIRRSMDILGPKRILFGTDQPLFAPWFEYGAYLDAIQSEEEAELVFRQNARRIFRLGID
ncbi:amidohydrolase [Chloroflexi bacterium TSY]|nr:amidohydrolase [Chloroflexi bacterium TSY]